jgi:hypothetical protein
LHSWSLGLRLSPAGLWSRGPSLLFVLLEGPLRPARAWKRLLGGVRLLLLFSWPRRKGFPCPLSSLGWKEPNAVMVVLLPLFLLLPSQLLLARLLVRPRRPAHPPWFRPPLLLLFRPHLQLPWFRPPLLLLSPLLLFRPPLLLFRPPLRLFFRPPLLVLFRPLLLVLGFPHRPFLALSTFSIAPHRPMVSAALGDRLSMPRIAAFTFVPCLDLMWALPQFLMLVVVSFPLCLGP